MKRKNASISNADILYNYVHNNCPRRFFIDFYGVFSILSTLFMLCGQIVDKLSSVDKFIIFSIFNNSLFYKGLRGFGVHHSRNISVTFNRYVQNMSKILFSVQSWLSKITQNEDSFITASYNAVPFFGTNK